MRYIFNETYQKIELLCYRANVLLLVHHAKKSIDYIRGFPRRN